ncbi:MAG: hypothetical protein Q9201_004868 [Fulgogasparrea decipioides]
MVRQNGRPRSRPKAKTMREEVARKAFAAQKSMTKIMHIMALVPESEPVASEVQQGVAETTTYMDQWNKGCEETSDMQKEGESSEFRQDFTGGHVNENGNYHNTPIHQCPLPEFRGIAWIIQLSQG